MPFKTSDGTDLTLGDLAAGALLYGNKSDDDNKKRRNFKIFQKIANGGDVELEVTEIATIKKILTKSQDAIVVGQIDALLEGNPNPLEPAGVDLSPED